MRKISFVVQLFLVCIAIFTSGSTWAVPCAPDENGECIKIVVEVGPDDSGGLIAGGRLPSGGGGSGGTIGSRPSWQGTLCRAALGGLGAGVCAAVGTACTAGTVVTVGTVAIPCAFITYSVCVTAAAGAIVGGEQLCKP